MDDNTSQPRLTLHRGQHMPTKFVWSPFVTKVELRLRHAGLKYTTDGGMPNKGPQGKIPYLDIDAPDGSHDVLGDSGFITQALEQTGWMPDVNAALSPAMKAHDMALRAVLEDKLAFFNMRERWVEHYYIMRDNLLSPIPWPLRNFVGLMIWRGVTKTLHGQGAGRYTHDEVAVFKQKIWQAVSDLLQEAKSSAKRKGGGGGKEPFWVLGGEEMTEADSTFFGFVVSVMRCDAAPDSKVIIKEYPVILEYAQRIKDKYFPDYDKWD